MRRYVVAGLAILAVSLSTRGQSGDSLKDDEATLKAAKLETDGPALLEFFRKRTLTDDDRKRIDVLIGQLGDDDFGVREKAAADLVKLGPKSAVLLRLSLHNPDREIAGRAEACLQKLEPGGKEAASRALPMAAIRLLADRKPAGAAEALLDYLIFADDDAVVDEIETALTSVAAPGGKLEPAIRKALTAKEPLRRAVAGAALARAKLADQKKALGQVLKDAEPTVRLRVAMALASVKDKESVPVLIDLLGVLTPEQAWPIENLLHALAAGKSPSATLGTDADSRTKCRAAWAVWWRENADTVVMVAPEAGPPLLGFTLVVVTDYGTVMELDRNGKVRWRVGGMQSPFDAQLLPNNRILVAEYSGRVTERDMQGKILWQAQVPSAMQCQRLGNGKTFVVTTRQLLEIDNAGKQTVLYGHHAGSSVVAAKRLRSGHMIVIDSDGTCVRLDASGKAVSKFAAGRISNSCLDVLPNGNILIAKFFDGKVCEYNPKGKVVWEIDCPSAFSAQRLPNGNTLIACHQPARVVEFDRTGKQVWEHTLESPNHRPWTASKR